jgi:hypothetical protein
MPMSAYLVVPSPLGAPTGSLSTLPILLLDGCAGYDRVAPRGAS